MNPIRLLLAACALAVSAQAYSATRIYDVDPAYRQEVYEILSAMLDAEFADFGGRVQLLPTMRHFR